MAWLAIIIYIVTTFFMILYEIFYEKLDYEFEICWTINFLAYIYFI
jgi:hypothetical protein